MRPLPGTAEQHFRQPMSTPSSATIVWHASASSMPPTQRVALHQRDRADVTAKAAVEVMHAIDAATRVVEQALAVVVADQLLRTGRGRHRV